MVWEGGRDLGRGYCIGWAVDIGRQKVASCMHPIHACMYTHEHAHVTWCSESVNLPHGTPTRAHSRPEALTGLSDDGKDPRVFGSCRKTRLGRSARTTVSSHLLCGVVERGQRGWVGERASSNYKGGRGGGRKTREAGSEERRELVSRRERRGRGVGKGEKGRRA